MAPLLLSLGIKLASSERSHLVSALRLLAEAFDVCGDPRDELRRLIRKARELEVSRNQLLSEMIERALRWLHPG